MRLLTLPPLVIILLLVFLWFILLVLMLWFAFRPRRAPESRAKSRTESRADTAGTRSDSIGSQRRRKPREETPPPRPVRVVRSQREGAAEGGGEAQGDAFDDFVTGNRRDDFDF